MVPQFGYAATAADERALEDIYQVLRALCRFLVMRNTLQPLPLSACCVQAATHVMLLPMSGSMTRETLVSAACH